MSKRSTGNIDTALSKPFFSGTPLSLKIKYRRVDELVASPSNPRTHSEKQVIKLAASIKKFGFVNPVLTRGKLIVAGHGRWLAAKLLGIKEIPTIELAHLTDMEKRAYALADNRLAQEAGWDRELLTFEFETLIKLDPAFDVEITGFATAELDLLFEEKRAASADQLDTLPTLPETPPASRVGDLFELGPHRLHCGDAREETAVRRLLGNDKAQMVFTDPPFNEPVRNISGFGKKQHPEFRMASGEMTRPEFVAFLKTVLTQLVAALNDGAILYICIDWRHQQELLAAAAAIGLELKNLVVWDKGAGGMGSFYRSQHELIPVFKTGAAPHINNFGLGDTGRYRTNVWNYPRPSSAAGDGDLDGHPTIKPVALVADAIRDCSKRNGVVLDAFGGSGTTLIAAQRTGRRAYLLELDPRYVDLTIKRWQQLTGEAARHVESGMTFDELIQQRPAPTYRSRRRPVAQVIGK